MKTDVVLQVIDCNASTRIGRIIKKSNKIMNLNERNGVGQKVEI